MDGTRLAMSGGVTFTPESARRIARVVKSYETDGVTLARGRYRRNAAGFSGVVYLAGKLFDLRGSARKKWIKIDTNAGTVAYTDTDPTDPFPAGEEYYLTNETWGDIHVTRHG